MPKHVEPRHGVVNLFHNSCVESLDARDCRPTFTLSSQKHQTGAAEQLTGKTARNSPYHVETFLLGHRADDAADHRVRRPAALAAPIAWSLHLRRGDPRIDHLDKAGGNARFHHDGL